MFVEGRRVQTCQAVTTYPLLLLLQALHQLPPPQLPPIGTKLLLQPGHCDPTVNMYDSIVALRDSKVVGVWPVAARGPGL